MKKKGLWLPAALIVVCLLVTACKPKEGHGPLPEALASLQSDNEVLCSHNPVAGWDNDSYYIFKPKDETPSTALVFYGGANCDARAYAPLAREIARAGFLMVLVKMPKDTSMRAPNRAEDVIETFPDIATWAIGGHSMGGISACGFAKEHLEEIDAVVLWASYPSDRNALDQTSLKALSVSATLDGVYPPDTIEKSRAMLPQGTKYHVIEGGNHLQFGWYTGDHKPVDGDPTISRNDQMTEIVDATVSFLESLY